MKTERIYREDPYAIAVLAKVVDIIDHDDRIDVALNRSTFFPEGGGQASDTGYLIDENDNAYEVVHAYDTGADDLIYHSIASNEVPLKVGDSVTAEIDFDRRFKNMQRHTGEHILSGAFYSTVRGRNKGFHMGQDYITIDIDTDDHRILEPEEIALAERSANRTIWDDLEISTVYYDNAEDANKAPVRKEVDLEGVISVVFVGDQEEPFDCVACCGTHVKSAGEVGIIKVYKVEVNKGMNRVYFDCGEAAFDRICEEMDILTRIANRHSTAKEELEHRLDVEAEKNKAQRENAAALKSYYSKNKAKEFALIRRDSGSEIACIDADELESEDLVKFAFDCLKEAESLLSESADHHCDTLALIRQVPTHTLVLASNSDKYNCGALVKENAFALGGKGGGRPDNARAIFTDSKSMKAFIEKISEK